jgi:arylsulfatase A-like enzyme
VTRPNFVFIMSDDHAAHAISAYGSVVNETPNIDRIAAGGMRFDSCFCTNSICAPSRAAILTGTYNHVNGVRTLSEEFESTQDTFVTALAGSGYQNAIVGKWHLGHGPGHDPHGFDYWEVLPGQGDYFDPEFITAAGRHRREGYATDIITDLSLDWLEQRDRNRPFCLQVNHKAPHRPWQVDEAHAKLYADVDIPEPATWHDDYSHRSEAARTARMTVRHDLTPTDLKEPVPDGLTAEEEASWKYQRYMKDYLRCIAAIDDNVGRLLDYLDAEGLSDNTVVVYTSDQGFFLGDHGWYDKRFMYEESLRMPFLVRYPPEIAAGSHNNDLVLNVDFAQTFLDLADVPALLRMQGRSIRPLLQGNQPDEWRGRFYYRYWEHDSQPHRVRAHYGLRTDQYKLIYYYSEGLGAPGSSDAVMDPEWELFDLRADPHELRDVHDDPAYSSIFADLRAQLAAEQELVGDDPVHR